MPLSPKSRVFVAIAALGVFLTGCPGQIDDPSAFGASPGPDASDADGGLEDADIPLVFDAGPSPAVDAGPPVEPPPPLTPYTYEAEDMDLTTYEVDAVNPEVIRLPDGAATGTASVTFAGATGRYYVTVHAQAESDGQPQLIVRVGATEVFTSTYPLGAAGMEALALGPYEIELTEGDVITLEGTADAGAWARVDRVELTP